MATLTPRARCALQKNSKFPLHEISGNMTSTTTPAENEKPWHAAYPPPVLSAAVIKREELLGWVNEGKVAGRDYVLVDLRRVDYEVCF